MTRPRALLAGAVGLFAAGMSALSVLQHRAFETGRFDVGNLTQAVWSTAHGRFLEVTDLQGRQISRLGAHFDPIVAVLAPAWRLWPHPSLLLVTQAVAVAFGAVPVFLLARKHLESEWAGLAFAVVYLLYPPTQWLVLDDFHPVALATPLLLAAVWFLDEERVVPFAACAALASLTKEQVGLAVAALGLWYALAHGRRLAGAAIALAGTVVAGVAVAVVVPHYAPGGGSPFAGRYAEIGGSPAGIVSTLVTDPLRVLGAATSRHDLAYLADLVLPLAGLAVLAPALALTALPEIALNVLSSTRTQTSIHFHYTAAAIPGLVAASVLGAARLRRRLPRLAPAVPACAVAVTLLAGVVLGPLPLWRDVPFGSRLGTRDHIVTAHDRVAAEALRRVPPDAVVSATNTLGAHLSARRRIYSFPLVRDATWIAVDTTRPSYLDDAVAPARFRLALRQLLSDPGWRVAFSRDGVLLLRRR